MYVVHDPDAVDGGIFQIKSANDNVGGFDDDAAVLLVGDVDGSGTLRFGDVEEVAVGFAGLLDGESLVGTFREVNGFDDGEVFGPGFTV